MPSSVGSAAEVEEEENQADSTLEWDVKPIRRQDWDRCGQLEKVAKRPCDSREGIGTLSCWA